MATYAASGKHFASIASDSYFRVTSPRRSYWFTFTVSNGYGGISLLPVSDPYNENARENGPNELLADMLDVPETIDLANETLRTLRFYSFDSDLTVFSDPPNSGEQTPAYLMVPQTGLMLWYAPNENTDDTTASRDPMPVGMFKPSACRDTPLPPAFP